jgi:hypothetical protein
MKLLGLAPAVLTLAVGAALAIGAGAGARRAMAAEKNTCGCYKDDTGTCYCDKKAKCGCPGDCEPKGCNEAREKQIRKEIEAETKKAAEAGRRGHTTANSDDDESPKAKGEVMRASAKTSEKTTSEPEVAAPTKAKKMAPAQVKQLVKLLDLYFAENPDARGRNAEEIRNELSQSR